MEQRHFTAWMVNDPSCLAGAFMDVAVIEDAVCGYRTVTVSEEYDNDTGKVDVKTAEVPEWVSSGEQRFHAETTVVARGGDAQDGIREAEELLSEAGWTVAGKWEATDNAYYAAVEKEEKE